MGLTYAEAERLGIAGLHPDHPGNFTPPAPVLKPAAAPAPRRSPSKYRNVVTLYNGVNYPSKAEANRAAALDDLRARGLVVWWLAQPRFRLGCPENLYVADFLVAEPAGEGAVIVRVEDVKGVETPKFVRDKKLWAAYGPVPLWILRRGKVVEVVPPGAGAVRGQGGNEPC